MSTIGMTRFSEVRSDLWVEAELRARLQRWLDKPGLETSFADPDAHQRNAIKTTYESLYDNLFCIACGVEMRRATQTYLDWRKVQRCGSCSGDANPLQCRHCGRDEVACIEHRCGDCEGLWARVTDIVHEEMAKYSEVRYKSVAVPKVETRRASSVFSRIGNAKERADKLTASVAQARAVRPEPARKPVVRGLSGSDIVRLRRMKPGMRQVGPVDPDASKFVMAIADTLRGLRNCKSDNGVSRTMFSDALRNITGMKDAYSISSKPAGFVLAVTASVSEFSGTPTVRQVEALIVALERYQDGCIGKEDLASSIAATLRMF